MWSTFDVEGSRVDVHASGPVTFDEVVRNFRWYISQPEFQPDMDVLVDLREATLELTLEQLREVTRTFEHHREQRGQNYKLAIVTSTAVTYGQSRQFDAFSHSSPVFIGVFEDIEAARKWLGA